MNRHTRYQGAVLRGDQILLIRHRHFNGRSYWLLPGGGREEGESEEACVQREMLEETGLTVRVERLLLVEDDLPDGVYKQIKTYLCVPLGSSEPQPGYEPEVEAAASYEIVECGWFNLHDPASWGEDVQKDPFTYPLLRRLSFVV